MYRIVLASGSPRRKELLSQMGLDFEIMLPDTDEHTDETQPAAYVESLSLRKATSVARKIKEDGGVISTLRKDYADIEQLVVLGSDTVVTFEGKILGKPRDEADALAMLTMLQGKTHRVYTGVALVFPDDKKSPLVFSDYTDVTMYPESQEDLISYIQTGEPMDKAGAYGIQGRGGMLVKEIHGDYNTVVGLPAAHVYQELKVLK